MNSRFTILGRVGVWHGGGWTRLGSPKLRALIIPLLINARRSVSSELLIGYLWDRPPASAESNLRSFVSQLRRQLQPVGVEIHGGCGSYEIDVPPSQVDVLEFQSRTAHGRRLIAQAPAEACVALEAALSLWQGVSGMGASGSARLDALLTNLDLERASVTEDWFAARYASGDHLGLAGQIRDYLIGDPTRERSWELLIRVEASQGNVACGLRAYQDYRRMRRDELGLPPAAELGALNAAIIAGRLTSVGA